MVDGEYQEYHRTRERARAIYDHVVDHMDYNKTTPGWGNGDTLRACDVGKGNCTDKAKLVSRANEVWLSAFSGRSNCRRPARRDMKVVMVFHSRIVLAVCDRLARSYEQLFSMVKRQPIQEPGI